MKTSDTILIRALALVGLVLLLTAGARHASPLQNRPVAPTLARLSFWVPSQRMAEFATDYEAKVVPILEKHGLVASAERGRATPDSIFSRLFELKTPSEVEEKQKALQGDSTWTAALRGLGTAFERAGPDGLMQSSFTLYATPAGPGKTVPAGPGKTVPAGPGTGHWRTYDVTDGLSGARVWSIFQDQEGYLWFGTMGGGASRYDGQTFTTFTTKEGLAHNDVRSIFQDQEEYLWFGTVGGVSRYDGQKFITFTIKDGLVSNGVGSVCQDREGNLWFGGFGGVSRYDGRAFTTFTTQDGLAANVVRSIFQGREGHLWFGTYGGVSRYDGQAFTTFTTQDGLASDVVNSILQDREGRLWFGTSGEGVSRYDGRAFTTFTAQDGLGDNIVWSILQDREGYIWFGTFGGVSRYDGQVFQTLTRWDGLANNTVLSISQDRDRNLWFGTSGGVTRYRPPAPSPPPTFIDAVVSDRRYEKVSELAIPSSIGLTIFEFHGMNFKTRPEAMVYRYRLKGYDQDWKNTHARRVEYQNLPRGAYTFEVQAVDRDLIYSEKPATVTLRVHPPYMLIGLWSALGIAVALIAYQAGRIIQRDRKLQEANTALSSANKELFQANTQIQEATQRKSAFLASMSHELRTPMNAIMGFTRLVLRREGDRLSERQRDNLVKVGQSADHLLALINDILDLSKVEAGRVDIKPVQFDVKALIASCCATVSPLVKPGVALNHEVSEDVGEAHTDEARLRQVVINLLSNALKFTEKGEVRVSVWPSPRQATLPSTSRSHEVATRSPTPLPHVGEGKPSEARRGEGLSPHEGSLEDKTLEIAVSDTGVGIPSDALGYIFEEFRQVEGSHQQQKGTGLGLSITKKLTELLGGTIRVESEVGKGSTFTVRVPMMYQGN